MCFAVDVPVPQRIDPQVLVTFLSHPHQAKTPTCSLEISKYDVQTGMKRFPFGPSVSFP